jgi:hypothetical protein
VRYGDIVKVSESAPDHVVAGCYGLVEEIREDGILVNVSTKESWGNADFLIPREQLRVLNDIEKWSLWPEDEKTAVPESRRWNKLFEQLDRIEKLLGDRR